MAKRRRFTARFKARVALEALRGRAHGATDRGAARGASELGEPVEAQGARGAGRGVPRGHPTAALVERRP